MYTLAVDSRKTADAQTGHAHLKNSIVRGIRCNQVRQLIRIWFGCTRELVCPKKRYRFANGAHAFENTSIATMVALIVPQTKRVPTGQTQLSFQNRLHVRALQWKPSEDLSGCIMEGRGDRWSSEGVGGFGTSAVCADFEIVNEDNFDFGSVGHFGDGVGVPVARSDSAFIEHGFFIERMADAHHGAAFDLPL